MAFSREEILKVLSDPELTGDAANLSALQQSSNFPIIMDYLMGKSNSLQGIIADHHNYRWQGLPALLERSTSIGLREQLLLDVATHPDISPYLQHRIHPWLLYYALNNPTTKAFNEVLTQFKKQGWGVDEVFNYFISSLGFQAQGTIELQNTPVMNFLVDFIRNSTSLLVPVTSYGLFVGASNWNHFYFGLLEKVKPGLAADYAKHMAKGGSSEAIEFLNQYKGGKYLEGIEQSLTNVDFSDMDAFRAGFGSALQLFDTNPAKYRQTVITISRKYLAYSLENLLTDSWESGHHLNEFRDTDISYLPYSTCAFHILLKYDKDVALHVIDSWIERKGYIHYRTFGIIYHHLQQDSWQYVEKALMADTGQRGIEYYRLVFGFVEQKFDAIRYLPIVWKMVSTKSRPMRELVAKILAANDPQAEQKAIGLLQDKNAESRITAALILSLAASPTAKEAVMSVLNKETNDNVRDLLLQIAVDSLPREADMAFVTSMVDAAQKRGKLNKPVEAWLIESEFPPLYFNNGEPVPLPVSRFLLYRMSRAKEMRSDPEARYVIQQLDKEKSAPFAFELISIFKNKGAKPEHKYLMLLAALLGSDSIVDKIRLTINKWIEENRIKMAEHGIGALALQGSDKALRWVEWYSRKYKSSKAKIGAAALQALENAAEESGITTHELGDKIVPNFDFDGLFKHFTVNGDEYRAFIDSNFKIAFFNEDNKKIKSVPAAADPALKDELKAIAKEVRDIVKSQSPRLEYYLIIQRRWSFDKWQQFFLQNPIMFIYATKLLWGVYDAGGKIVQTFLCNDDTSLIDVNQEEISPDETKLIGIVHPSQLNVELLQQWKQLFFDLSIESIFPQLDRAMPDMKDIDLSKKFITKFAGKQMKQGSTRSTLEKFGWSRGPVGDGGMLESINLKYHEKNLEAVLEVEGIGVGYGWGGDDRLGRFYIINTSANAKQQFTSFREDDERLATLESVPGIFLREALAAIEAIKPLEKIT